MVSRQSRGVLQQTSYRRGDYFSTSCFAVTPGSLHRVTARGVWNIALNTP